MVCQVEVRTVVWQVVVDTMVCQVIAGTMLTVKPSGSWFHGKPSGKIVFHQSLSSPISRPLTPKFLKRETTKGEKGT